jgi:hypothetical protein
VTYLLADSAGRTVGRKVASRAYLNEYYGGGGCGGLGEASTFINDLTFPVAVRVVAWDERGCLAEPVCMSVP